LIEGKFVEGSLRHLESAALEASIREAKVWLEAKYDAGLSPFYPGSRWTVPAMPEPLAAELADFNDPDKYSAPQGPPPQAQRNRMQ
jgi:hypothetical protein